jgi:nucleotide-binding universal stress UspA family protein
MTATTPSRPILICYDGSAGARRAIETAGELFPGHRVIVLHAWSPVSVVAASYGGALSMPVWDDDALQAEASKVTEAGCKLATNAGLKAQPEIAEVSSEGTWHTILDIANQYDAELIVLGARGLSAVRSIVLGSVSYSVAQHPHLPVPIVPPDRQPEDAVAEIAEHAAATA